MMDIRGADLPLLVSLDRLLEEKNVSRAAQRLHLSQPALSAQLARLRTLFGDPLLMPAENGRGMVATPYALTLQQPLRAALEALNQAVAQTPAPFDPRNAKRTFRIAGNDNSITMVMMSLLRQIDQAGGPDLKLAFVPHDLNRIVGQMERGEIDLLAGGPRFAPDALRIRRITQTRYRMAQRKGHPRGTGPLDLAGYCQLRHVIVSNEGGFRGFMDALIEAQGYRRDVAVSVSQYGLVPAILAATDLVCSLPQEFLACHTGQLDIIDLPLDAGQFDLSIAWHPRSDNDPAHRWLRAQLLGENTST
ncbi:LysR family transcriptional regulator [Duganella sp. CY15W]|uniref:LysR family transcriptional regulator n=1 Tax=Duganella sp. CY15W TaxID=2692172 RepID=UPI00136E9AE3|nr:LysR family transcriptional regulator [Duganella sp. CY15W]MYM30139.1 LysR family transcriptional regulator [Duganella sp. CY15W]